jgi:hypothetical protein
MRTLLSLLLNLFPHWWRNRYEPEFRAMSEEIRFGCSDYIDTFKLAVEVRMSGLSGMPAWKVVLALAVTGAAIGAGAAVVWPARYQSSAVIRIVPDADAKVLSATELANSALNSAALQRVLQGTGLDTYQHNGAAERIANFRRDINIVAVGRKQDAILVQYVASKPELAQRVTAALVDNLRGAIPPSYAGKVIDPASLDQDPISPNRTNIVITAILAGVLCGLIVAGLTMSVRRRPPLRAA